MHADERLPDPARLREYPLDVFRVRFGTSHFLKTLTNAYGGLFGHHKQRRTHYCPGDECSCDLYRLPRVWYGYAACVRWDAAAKLWLPVVFQVSEALDHCFQGRYRRGQVWQVSREPEARGKPCPPILGRLTEELAPQQVPEPFDVRPVLLRIFRVREVRLDHGNPVPPPVKVVVPEAPPPRSLAESRPTPIPEHIRERLRNPAAGIGDMPSENGRHGKGVS